jgi:hypothetical protein
LGEVEGTRNIKGEVQEAVLLRTSKPPLRRLYDPPDGRAT